MMAALDTLHVAIIVGAIAYGAGLYVGAICAWLMAGRTWSEFWHGTKRKVR